MFVNRPRHWRSRFLIVLGLAGTLSLPAAHGSADYLHRLGVDFLLPLRYRIFGPLFEPGKSDVIAVVIDEESHRTEPFAETPEVAWTPFLAQVLDAVAAAQPTVIGLDLIYPKSLDSPDLIPGYDKPLLATLLREGRGGKLVLGQLELSRQRIVPYRAQILAVGGAPNLRSVNLVVDADDVVRRYRARFPLKGGGSVTSFAAELARRAGASIPDGDFLINYNAGADDIPTYSLADLYRCVSQGNSRFFERFRDKIVIVGSALDVEDRHLPANRFVDAESDRRRSERCAIPFDDSRFGEIARRRTIPGLYIHAAAVNTLTRQLPLRLMPPTQRVVAVTWSVVIFAALFFLLPPVPGLLAGGVVTAFGIGGALIAFRAGTVLPIALMLGAGLLSYAVIYAYRFVVESKEKRWIKNAFRHFLAPVLVDQLIDDPSVLALGGEERNVTVFFTDLAGFTLLSEKMRDTPDRLVRILNQYLTVISDIVERRGGYIDKYIGDSVMAIWGVPIDDPLAGRHAVDAALDCQPALQSFNAMLAADYPDVEPLHTRIGINSGTVIAGNMGSHSRLNYTVAGDAVNIGARLEEANKTYGTQILVGEDVVAALGDDYVTRCIDFLAVRGRMRPIRVYEVLGRAGEVSDPLIGLVDRFDRAFALYQSRQFEAAADIFSVDAESDRVARIFVLRCEQFIDNPPDEDWDGGHRSLS